MPSYTVNNPLPDQPVTLASIAAAVRKLEAIGAPPVTSVEITQKEYYELVRLTGLRENERFTHFYGVTLKIKG